MPASFDDQLGGVTDIQTETDRETERQTEK